MRGKHGRGDRAQTGWARPSSQPAELEGRAGCGCAGIFLLLGERVFDPKVSPYLLPIGLFWLAVTIGLFMYELRGIQKCNAIITCAKKLEKELIPILNRYGYFKFRPKSISGAGVKQAGILIYSTVVAGWTFVAGVGGSALAGWEASGRIIVLTIVAILGALSCGRKGRQIVREQDLRIEEEMKKADASLP